MITFGSHSVGIFTCIYNHFLEVLILRLILFHVFFRSYLFMVQGKCTTHKLINKYALSAGKFVGEEDLIVLPHDAHVEPLIYGCYLLLTTLIHQGNFL